MGSSGEGRTRLSWALCSRDRICLLAVIDVYRQGDREVRELGRGHLCGRRGTRVGAGGCEADGGGRYIAVVIVLFFEREIMIGRTRGS